MCVNVALKETLSPAYLFKILYYCVRFNGLEDGECSQMHYVTVAKIEPVQTSQTHWSDTIMLTRSTVLLALTPSWPQFLIYNMRNIIKIASFWY